MSGEGLAYEFLKRTFQFAPGRAEPLGPVYRRFRDELPPESRSEWTKEKFAAQLPFACPAGRIPGWKSRYSVANISSVAPASGDPPGRLLVRDPLDPYQLMREGDTPRRTKKKPRKTYTVAMTVARLPGVSGMSGGVVVEQRAASGGGAARAAIARVERTGGVVTSVHVG